MKILVSNDDGVYAPGINYLNNALKKIAKTWVVAPDRDRSAASKSLTLLSPLRPHTLENGFISVDGTPTDCVHLALTALLEQKPDMVVSGINAGANLGDDVMYSGTVAAATEGRFLGLPSIAVSLCGDAYNYASAGQIVQDLMIYLISNPLPSDTILNVNIPDLPYEEIRGFKVVRLGRRHQSEPMIPMTDPRGKLVYWVGAAGPEEDDGEGTDFHAIRNGFVSLTPLAIDLTKYSAMQTLTTWVDGLEVTQKVS